MGYRVSHFKAKGRTVFMFFHTGTFGGFEKAYDEGEVVWRGQHYEVVVFPLSGRRVVACAHRPGYECERVPHLFGDINPTGWLTRFRADAEEAVTGVVECARRRDDDLSASHGSVQLLALCAR